MVNTNNVNIDPSRRLYHLDDGFAREENNSLNPIKTIIQVNKTDIENLNFL